MPESIQGGLKTDTQARSSRLIRVIATSGLAVLVINLIVGFYSRAPLINMLIVFSAVLLLIASLLLVRRGHIAIASFMLPAIGWLVGNSLFLVLPKIHPLLFVSVNGIMILLAGALLGHRAILYFAILTALYGLGVLVAASQDLLVVHREAPENWFTGYLIFLFLSLLSYYAFRDRYRAMQEAQQRTAETETILEATSAVAASLNMEETLERILFQLERVVPYHTASAQILKDGVLEIVGGRGWDESAEVLGIQFPVPDDNFNTEVIQSRETIIMNDAQAEYEAYRQPPHNHIRSVLGVPLIIGDELIGMLSIDHRQPGFYDQSHARLARAFADQVALAIRNAQHFQAEQRRRQLAAMQQDITQITSASLELDEVLQRITSLTCQTIEADLAILLVQPKHGTIDQSIELHRCNPEVPDQLMAEVENDLLPRFTQDILGEIVPQFGAARLNLALSNLSGEHASFLQQWFEGRQGLIVPLIAAGHSTGFMLLVRLAPDPRFDDSSIEIAETIAQSVATSIENASLYSQMERMAITDGLTGLYNRRGLTQMGQREIDRARRFDRAFSVLMLDLDHFKELNDTHGHAAGDNVLRQLADLLSQLVRSIDVVARYGGEEFTILLPECPHDCGQEGAERLRRAVGNTTFQTDAGELELSISLGLASGGNMSLDLEALIEAADRALYAAKEAGRNQCWSWHPEGPRPIEQ